MPRNPLSVIDRHIEASGRYKNRSAFLAELARKKSHDNTLHKPWASGFMGNTTI
ncbi:hypothetical protein HGT70_14450 [Rosenbergiella collisarenosi]|nr:hypothetical protein [Rosenbergiella collisarenosi]